MHRIVLVSCLVASWGLVGGASAQEDAVTVPVNPVNAEELLVLWVEDVVRKEQPLVRVREVKVRLDPGTPERTAPTIEEQIEFKSLLRDDSVYFRVYRGADGVGIFKYKKVSKKRRPGRGTWLEALPLDRDETFQDMTRDARDSADIEVLLSMDIEEAEKAARREEMLDRMIADAIAREWRMLESGQVFLVPTRPSANTGR